jgi:molecular chaperone GrpE (heat shock protein)
MSIADHNDFISEERSKEEDELQRRIAELEAEAARWRDRYADAMAKLARVAERAERKHPVENDTAKMADGVIRNIEEISNILADTPKEVE